MTQDMNRWGNEHIADLLRRARSGQCSERNESMRTLRELVAFKVYRRTPGWSHADQEDVVQEICEKLIKDAGMPDALTTPSRAAARFWCIVKSACIDASRKRKRRCETIRPFSQDDYGSVPSTKPHDFDQMMAKLDRDCAMPVADLAQVSDWGLHKRLVLLSLTGLWRAVPSQLWTQWVLEYGLVMPFPTQSFLDETDAQERNRMLSETLGIPRNTLSQTVLRGKPLLLRLSILVEQFR